MHGGVDFSLVGLWSQMGLVAKGVVVILMAMSIYSLGITVERIMTFGKAKKLSMGYIARLQPVVAQPGRLKEAVGFEAQFIGSPVAKVIGTGINEYVRGLEALAKKGPDDLGDFDIVDAVNRSMERVKEREIANLRRGLTVLATVSSSAPFVGLFGTVFGIINSFRSMASSGGGGLGSVSAGIAEALLTTAVGLAVAIVAVWFYNFFTNRVDEFTIDIDETASEIIEAMLKEGRPGPGAVTRAMKAQA